MGKGFFLGGRRGGGCFSSGVFLLFQDSKWKIILMVSRKDAPAGYGSVYSYKIIVCTK